MSNRIKPTCRQHPGIEPVQLRKWIRNLEALESAQPTAKCLVSSNRQQASPCNIWQRTSVLTGSVVPQAGECVPLLTSSEGNSAALLCHAPLATTPVSQTTSHHFSSLQREMVAATPTPRKEPSMDRSPMLVHELHLPIEAISLPQPHPNQLPFVGPSYNPPATAALAVTMASLFKEVACTAAVVAQIGNAGVRDLNEASCTAAAAQELMLLRNGWPNLHYGAHNAVAGQ